MRQATVRAGKAAAGQPPGASVRRSPLRGDCTAVLGLAAPLRNSRRSLRSLWSNRRNESVHEARCARGPQALCSSPPHRRAQRQPSPGLAGGSAAFDGRGAPSPRQGCGPASAGVSRRRRGTQPWGRRAQRASSTDSPRLFERSERSERSELCGATPGRVPQRTPRSGASPSEPRRWPARSLARTVAGESAYCGRSRTAATGRKPLFVLMRLNAFLYQAPACHNAAKKWQALPPITNRCQTKCA